MSDGQQLTEKAANAKQQSNTFRLRTAIALLKEKSVQ